MANIRKIEGKSGTAYKITVTSGRDMDGKQIRHYLTWTPAVGMTERQAEKAVQKASFEFEQSIELGYVADNKQTFAKYAEYVLELKERSGAKYRTIERYGDLLKRIYPAIGHLKLSDIRPQHLNTFYANLAEEGIRSGWIKAIPKMDFAKLIKENKLTRARLSELANVAPATITKLTKGATLSSKSAQAISKALNMDTDKLFTFEHNTAPLSKKTITEYHRLISTILSQAEREMLIPYNAAHKATPPKLQKKEVECFQPEEVIRIRDCLEQEPLKWRTITHLLLVTGCRRGEIMGLHWDAVDWKANQIKIDRALLYSPKRGIYEDTTKTRETRFIKLPEETMCLLKDYKQWYLEQRFKNGDQWHNTGYVFIKDNGEPMHPDSITQWLGDFTIKYALPRVYPHKFRHTMASLLYFNGLDSVTISKRLGHAKVSTTTDIYSHIIKQADERAADCIADVVLRKKA